MVADPGVEIVYISSPHSHHLEHTLAGAPQRKACHLRETDVNKRTEVKLMAEEARRQGLFLMEALWPPFQPSYHKADEILKSGKMGRLLHMRGKFAFIHLMIRSSGPIIRSLAAVLCLTLAFIRLWIY